MNDETFAQYVPALIKLFRQGYSSSEAAVKVLAAESGDKYVKMIASGSSREAVASVMVGDDRDRVMRAEMFDVDAGDRARIEAGVKFGAKELGVAAPRIRYFKSAGFPFRGTSYEAWPNEIWVGADRPFHEMGYVALHELAHTAHFADDTPREIREHDADRFAARGRHWF